MSGEHGGGARSRILGRIGEALRGRKAIQHPGLLPKAVEPPVRFGSDERSTPVDAFEARFEAAGGEVVRLAGEREAIGWLRGFTKDLESVAPCRGVPKSLRSELPVVDPSRAALGISMALGAAAQTGSLLLTSREGRRAQLLPPVQLVWVRADDIHATLGEALGLLREDLPAALALHSGPSKSADIGQILVRGVHGPGRIVAAITSW